MIVRGKRLGMWDVPNMIYLFIFHVLRIAPFSKCLGSCRMLLQERVNDAWCSCQVQQV